VAVDRVDPIWEQYLARPLRHHPIPA
jgi:hypothetical protein